MCKKWVGDWTDRNILTPSSFVFSSTSFSFCWAAQPGILRAQTSAVSGVSLPRTATKWLQLTRTVCCTGLYHCLTSICFLWASHLHPIQPVHGQGYMLMSSTGCTCFSIDSWVEGQHVTFLRIMDQFQLVEHNFLRCVFVCASFRWRADRSNAQRVNARTTNHSSYMLKLTLIGHVIYAP